MAISKALHYNNKMDLIEGYEDDGVQRAPVIADQALVIAVRGVIRRFVSCLHFIFYCKIL